MRSVVPVLFLSMSSVFAQAPTVANARAAIAPDTVVATIAGKPYTAADVERIVQSFPKNQRANFVRAPKQFLEEWAQMQAIVEAGEQRKIAERSPYKEQLEELERQQQLFRKQILSQGELNERANAIPVTTDQMKARYDRDLAKYRQARVKLIYIPYSATASGNTEQQAREKAALIAKQARGGTDFTALVKEHSEDPASAAKGGDPGYPIKADTPRIPADIRQRILAGTPGEVTDPLNGNNGYYVFRIESIETIPYEQVKDEIFKEIQNAGLVDWINQLRAKVSVKVENEAFFAAPAAGSGR